MARVGGLKTPAVKTIKRLFALSSNRCAFPGCNTSLVDPNSGSILGEVCHIKGDKPTAARYDVNQSNAERHAFENLILLCNVHHKIVDDQKDAYTDEVLFELKQKHESLSDGKIDANGPMSKTFLAASQMRFGNQNEIVQTGAVNGGQVAHSIVNNYAAIETDEPIRIEGKATIATFNTRFNCPALKLKVACKSKRPAKIRIAVLSLLDHGIMAALQKGFDTSLEHNPVPDLEEEMKFEMFPTIKPSTPNGFVLQQDDVAEFELPALGICLGLFTIRPAEKMSLKLQYFDESEHVVVDGKLLKPQLEGLLDIAKAKDWQATLPVINMYVTAHSLTPPSPHADNSINPNPVQFGTQLGMPTGVHTRKPIQADDSKKPWYERKGDHIDYPELYQGNLPNCVFAAVAAAINYITRRPIWTGDSLREAHAATPDTAVDFSVANTAIEPVVEAVEQVHHTKSNSNQPLSIEKIRSWIDQGGVVILSMMLDPESGNSQRGWHMFSLMKHSGDRFQVWDTNGLKGFLLSKEIIEGFDYPNGWRFRPHLDEDTLILLPKQKSE
jgi:hypothetical protein